MEILCQQHLHQLKVLVFLVLTGDVLEWRDSKQTKPTESEIDAELSRLITEYNNKKYQRDRSSEYPSVVDQLDDIYHNGIEAWKATIKATKDKYPKP